LYYSLLTAVKILVWQFYNIVPFQVPQLTAVTSKLPFKSELQKKIKTKQVKICIFTYIYNVGWDTSFRHIYSTLILSC
jgi:hypothetical protein